MLHGYVINGTVTYQAESVCDFGYIAATNNVIAVAEGKRSYGEPEVVGSTGR